MLSIHPAFAVPLGDIQHPSPEAMNGDLESLIISLESQGATYRNPESVVAQPAGLFESTFDFFARPEPVVGQLRTFCWAALGDLIRQLNTALEHDTRDLRIGSQSWFHVTRNGGHFGFHNHPMASWSGVYCVSNGDPDRTVPGNGMLTFPTPNVAANAFLDVANATLRWPYSQSNLALDLNPGQLILFPSWLGHYVTPFQGSRPRITVAFNTWFNR